MCLGFKGDSNPLLIDKTKINKFISEKKLKYYNYKIHKSSFSLPNYLKDLLKI